MIENGKKVKFNFTLYADNDLVESTKDAPLEYTHGETDLLPSLAEALEGMKQEEEKEIVLQPEQAYGNHNPQDIQKFPKSAIPNEIKPELGMALNVKNQSGKERIARITDITNETVDLDFNHPLAGKTLKFNVKVVDVS